MQSAGGIEIVAAEPANYFTSCSGKPFIDRITLPFVLFAYPPGKMGFILFYNVNAVVFAATINNKKFKIRILLIDYRKDSFFQKLALVVRRNYNADLRKIHSNWTRNF